MGASHARLKSIRDNPDFLNEAAGHAKSPCQICRRFLGSCRFSRRNRYGGSLAEIPPGHGGLRFFRQGAELSPRLNDDSQDATGAPPNESRWSFRGYEREIVDRVWSFAIPVDGNDSELWRKDEFGAWIYRLDYGNRRSDFGWEIGDSSRGGREASLLSLRPIQWQNYIDLVAANTQCRVTADGLRNIRRLI